MSKRITSWSYSRWSDYDLCPAKAKFKHVDKLKEPDNDAMRNGTRVHDELAKYLGSPFTELEVPKSGARFDDLLRDLRALEPIHDQEWGFTEQWRVTGWFSNDTWFRSKLDVCIVYDDNTADVVDFKTGNASASHSSQAELYAISVFVRYANVSLVVVRFWYLDTGAEALFQFSRQEKAEMVRTWEKKVGQMLSDEIFAPKPGKHCKYCFFAKSNNGPCKFG